jgi:hypothetical protein
MLKKILAVAILTVALTFNSAPNTAESEDLYVGTSPATGWECYIVTESIKRLRSIDLAVLRMVKQNGDVSYLHYQFWFDKDNNIMKFNNDSAIFEEIQSQILDKYETPIEWEMWQTIKKYPVRS